MKNAASVIAGISILGLISGRSGSQATGFIQKPSDMEFFLKYPDTVKNIEITTTNWPEVFERRIDFTMFKNLEKVYIFGYDDRYDEVKRDKEAPIHFPKIESNKPVYVSIRRATVQNIANVSNMQNLKDLYYLSNSTINGKMVNSFVQSVQNGLQELSISTLNEDGFNPDITLSPQLFCGYLGNLSIGLPNKVFLPNSLPCKDIILRSIYIYNLGNCEFPRMLNDTPLLTRFSDGISETVTDNRAFRSEISRENILMMMRTRLSKGKIDKIKREWNKNAIKGNDSIRRF